MKSEAVTDNMMEEIEDIIMKEREEVVAEDIIKSEMKKTKVDRRDMGMTKAKERDDIKVMIIEESLAAATNKNNMTMIEELKVVKDNRVQRILNRKSLLLLLKISLNSVELGDVSEN